ncbi:hypothetical protein [Gordonia insulae]|uniref:TY-Chap C-terminal domain-containing protein n=1 Tax=Gordonia insulae TaxID=2420509 RepID=A0A3G8JTG7_9ACTN|nr:hypothetical protein [Gordonia insulae]AZG48203.1 hypothetical protein D7316_04820 [Gordonia insulae]
MRFQSELERLATLDADTIVHVCSSPAALTELIDDAVDECIEYDELADDHLASEARDDAAFCRQEAAAWRATASLLRLMAADTRDERRQAGAA